MSKKRIKGIYKALLTQVGLNAPVATVLENTLLSDGADIVWYRVGNGSYQGTLIGAFSDNKTFGFVQVTGNDAGFIDFDRGITNDVLDLFTNDAAGAASDDRLIDSPILIEVFE